MSTQRIDFLGLPLDVGVTAEKVCDMLRQKGAMRMVAYLNPSSWSIAGSEPEYLAALKQMSLIRTEGEGVSRICKWVTGMECPYTIFDISSLAGPFFKTAIAGQVSIMLLGGEPGVADQAEEKLLAAYPQLKITGVQHAYGEFAEKIDAVMAQLPDAVIVDLGSPRQELFLIALRDAGYKGMAITCDDFFTQYVREGTDYYPKWVNSRKKRFVYSLSDPQRMGSFIVDYAVLIGAALKAAAGKLRSKASGPRREDKASP